jgi:NAD(P)-dependent dehydrogenase (short-subunit alcohol dehydrogenase family)
MRRAGYGRIVNITSRGMNGLDMMNVYGAAKAGCYALTRGLAAEGNAHNIKVNSLSPAAYSRMGVLALEERSAFLDFQAANAPAELVSPAVALLAHEECPVSGEGFDAHEGYVARQIWSANSGYHSAQLTMECLRDNWAAVMDLDSSQTVPVNFDDVAPLLQPRAYQA